MTENVTELQLANYVCDELRKEMPFDLIFNQDELALFMNIIDDSNLTVGFPVKNIGDNTHIGVTKENLSALYEVFSSHIAEHVQATNSIDQFIASGEFDKAFESVFGLPIGVVDSLGEVS
jgi:hypothetical protein